MAAGMAQRFGDNKLAEVISGKSVFRRTLEAIPAESFQKTVVILNSPLFSGIVKEFHFTDIRNNQPEKGISRTISLGLSALLDCDGVLFCVADQPMLQRSTITSLIDFWKEDPAKIAALSYNGVRGNPCLFPARFFPALLALTGDQGGSAVIRQHKNDLRLLEVHHPIELHDIDTPEQLQILLDSIT